MSHPPTPTIEQEDALLELGLKRVQIPEFLSGRTVVCQLPTEGEPGVAMVQMVDLRLRSGIVSIKDPGGGV